MSIIRDARAVGLYEELLLAMEEIDPSWPEATGKAAVEMVARHYQDAGELGKAGEMLVKAHLVSKRAAFLGDTTLRAARFYSAAGEADKAQQAYATVEKVGYGWATGVSLYDRASVLIAQDKHKEARKLLSTPVTGAYAEQIEVVLVSMLGYSYYRTGEWQEARQYSQQAIDSSQKLQLLPEEGIEEQVAMAKRTLSYMAQWKKSPLLIEPAQLQVPMPTKNQPAAKSPEPLRVSFGVQSLKRVVVEVSSDNPLVKAYPADSERAADQGFCFENLVVVELSPQAVKEGFVDELHEDYLIPSVFDRRVATAVARAVVQEARRSGLARRIAKTN